MPIPQIVDSLVVHPKKSCKENPSVSIFIYNIYSFEECSVVYGHLRNTELKFLQEFEYIFSKDVVNFTSVYEFNVNPGFVNRSVERLKRELGGLLGRKLQIEHWSDHS